MAELKITKIEAKSLKVPLARAIGSANSTKSELDYLLVFLHTENGPTGCGFVMGLGGETSTDARSLHRKRAGSAGGGPGCPCARGALGASLGAEQAEDAGRPWRSGALRGGYRLLGRARQGGGICRSPASWVVSGNKVPVYGSGGWLTFTDAEMVDECMGFMEKGVGAYKLKLGTNRDEERIRILRKEVGEASRLVCGRQPEVQPARGFGGGRHARRIRRALVRGARACRFGGRYGGRGRKESRAYRRREKTPTCAGVFGKFAREGRRRSCSPTWADAGE